MKAIVATILVSAALAVPAKPKLVPVKAVKPCPQGDRLKRAHCRAHRLCSNRRPRWCVVNATIHYRLKGWAAAWMKRIPKCESGENPYAYNGAPRNRRPTDVIYGPPEKSAGLYEFKPSTWATTPYRHRSIWSAKWQSLAAGWMLVQGRSGEWACQ